MKRFTLAALAALLLVPFSAAPARADHAPVPAITQPTDGAVFCMQQGGTEMVVTVAGTIPSQVDSITVHDSATPIADGPPGSASSWGMGPSFAAGSHVLTATSVVTAEDSTQHESDPSAPVSFTVADPPVGIEPVARTLGGISPRNADGFKDAVTFASEVTVAGSVRFQVRTTGGAPVRTSAWVARGAGSTATWTWDGRLADGSWAPSRSYDVAAIWREPASGCTRELLTSVRVDNVAPAALARATPPTFYPAENDALTEYKDMVSLELGPLSEEALVRLDVVRQGTTRALETVGFGWKTGGSRFRWNGRTSRGELHPEGSYLAVWTLEDRLGNVRRYRDGFSLSHKRLVAAAAEISKRADAFVSYAESGCGGVYPGLSDWASGVYFSVLDCFYDDSGSPDLAATLYGFSVPSAAYYHSIALQGYGYSTYGDALYAAVLRGDDPVLLGGIAGTSPGLRTFGSKGMADRFVNDAGRVRIMLLSFSPCDCLDVDYDIRDITLTVRYGVLRA